MTQRPSIGGALNYAALANRHRPSDPARIAAEVARLHADQGLTANDISAALRIDHAQVVNILGSLTNSKVINERQ